MAAGPASLFLALAAAFIGGSWLGPRVPEPVVQDPKDGPLLEEIRGLRLDLLSSAPVAPVPKASRTRSSPCPACPSVPAPLEWWRNPLFIAGVVGGICLSRLWNFLAGLERAASTCLELARPRHRDGIRGEPLRIA